MKPSDFQKTTQCQFESLLKKVTRGIVANYRKELSRRQNKEVSFCELPEIVVENFAVWDDYETDYTVFNVCGIDIRVLDDKLAEALKRLPEKKRNILLMFYFLEMSDTEIGDLLNITRRSSHRNRTSSLDEIKKIFEEEK
ncbi:MAG: sigma factor-like helix-turn-helix DNA-binding protein [Lachnospiraceae bacterium]|nr:sigma factor-like helix-turn-helix DNA-binding protein [Lachnospiraceae bacterium]